MSLVYLTKCNLTESPNWALNWSADFQCTVGKLRITGNLVGVALDMVFENNWRQLVRTISKYQFYMMGIHVLLLEAKREMETKPNSHCLQKNNLLLDKELPRTCHSLRHTVLQFPTQHEKKRKCPLIYNRSYTYLGRYLRRWICFEALLPDLRSIHRCLDLKINMTVLLPRSQFPLDSRQILDIADKNSLKLHPDISDHVSLTWSRQEQRDFI